MANEIHYFDVTGLSSLYCRIVRASDLYIWDTVATAFAASPTWANTDIAMTENSSVSGLYYGSMPATAAGAYYVLVYQGASPASSDERLSQWTINWDGSAEITLGDLATAAALTAHDGKLDTVDGIVDEILVDTGTTIPAALTTIDGIVDDILVDTGTTIPATLAGTLDANIVQIGGVADDATKLTKMLYAFVNKVIETKTSTGSTLAVRNDADSADAYTGTITETTTTRTRSAIS